MKKVALAIAMAALVMFAGCKKDKETTGTTITASIEQQSGNGSRTSIVPAPDDKAEIHWTDGDKIVVNNGTSSQTFNLTAGAGGKTGTFTYNGEYTFSENNIAVYPETSTIGSDGITVTLPANKTLDAPGTGANPMMGIFSDPEQLTFTALGGALGIGLKGDNINITAVEIVSNANEQLNGTFTCTTSNPQINVTPSDDADAKKMRLTCTTTLTATPQYFYFPLPVGALAEGFTLNVYTEECVFTKRTTGNFDVTIADNKVTQMPDVTVKTTATITLTAGDVWGDGSGYQMLLDADANAFGTTIPETGALSLNCSGNEDIYDEFEYKIPTNADGVCTTQNIVLNNSISIEVPAGTYDWCITNPTPDDRIWIASAQGNVGGRQNDYVFEAGKTYEFTVTLQGNNDAVNVTITDGEGRSIKPAAQHNVPRSSEFENRKR